MRRDLTALPKSHLHVHLESTVRPSTRRSLGAPDPPQRLRGFADFAEYGGLVRDRLVRPADFTRIALEFCADEAAQGTRYAEVTFTAASHAMRLGVAPEVPLEAVLAGLAAGRGAYGIECRVLLDHPRRRGADRAWQTLRLAQRYASDGVAGMGLAGAEEHPVKPYAAVFAEAAATGVRLVHHAGETRGPASIREALTLGRAERIGHGITILDDPALVAGVRARGVALEVCPSSNVALGVVPSLAAHPLPRLLAAGLAVTINTDIPDVLGITLADEYARVRDAFGLSDAQLARLARTAVEASFAPPAVKANVHRDIDAWIAAPEPPDLDGSSRSSGAVEVDYQHPAPGHSSDRRC